MIPSLHRWLVGCVLDSKSVAFTTPKLVLVFANQVLNKQSYITCDDDVHLVTSTFVRAMKELDPECLIDLCEIPAEYPVIQTILQSFNISYMVFSLRSAKKRAKKSLKSAL